MEPDFPEIDLSLIRTDGGTQPRASDPDRATVEDYAAAYAAGERMPPVVLFHDGETYWLGDGFHRLAAVRSLHWPSIKADVRQGTQRDAILYSLGANAEHGRRRSNDDKRRAVTRMLDDREWGSWSAGAIARQCKVSRPFVTDMIDRRAKSATGLTSNVSSDRGPVTYTDRHGNTSQMDTSRIGRSQASPSPAAPAPEPEVSGAADAEAVMPDAGRPVEAAPPTPSPETAAAGFVPIVAGLGERLSDLGAPLPWKQGGKGKEGHIYDAAGAEVLMVWGTGSPREGVPEQVGDLAAVIVSLANGQGARP